MRCPARLRIVDCLHNRDVQLSVNGIRPFLRTWFSHYPIGRIDHIFLAGALKVVSVDGPRSELIRTASDHLPLVADLGVD